MKIEIYGYENALSGEHRYEMVAIESRFIANWLTEVIDAHWNVDEIRNVSFLNHKILLQFLSLDLVAENYQYLNPQLWSNRCLWWVNDVIFGPI